MQPPERRIGESALTRVLLVGACVVLMAVLLVLPLATVFVSALADGWRGIRDTFADPDAVAAIRLTALVAVIVVPCNTAFALAAAWCLTRFRFPGRGVLEALIALPLSVSPVISGLIYVLMFGARGWFGRTLSDHGLVIIFALPGIVLSTIFVTLPIVAGQIVPAMRAHGVEEEEAALTLGAGGLRIFLRVTLPRIRWALLSGVLLCNARAMGEFGAVSVVSGHIRGLTNTVPLHIEILYNEYAITAAFVLSAALALLGVATLGLRALLDWQARTMSERGAAAALVNA